jgi:hypothetical protein
MLVAKARTLQVIIGRQHSDDHLRVRASTCNDTRNPSAPELPPPSTQNFVDQNLFILRTVWSRRIVSN